MRLRTVLASLVILVWFGVQPASAIWFGNVHHYHYGPPAVSYGYPAYYCQPIYHPYYYGGGGVSIRAPFTRINVGW